MMTVRFSGITVIEGKPPALVKKEASRHGNGPTAAVTLKLNNGTVREIIVNDRELDAFLTHLKLTPPTPEESGNTGTIGSPLENAGRALMRLCTMVTQLNEALAWPNFADRLNTFFSTHQDKIRHIPVSPPPSLAGRLLAGLGLKPLSAPPRQDEKPPAIIGLKFELSHRNNPPAS